MTNDTDTVTADINVFSYEDGITKTFPVTCNFNSQDVIPVIVRELVVAIACVRNYGDHRTDTVSGVDRKMAEINTLNRLLTHLTGDIPADRALTYTLRVDALAAEKQAKACIRARRTK
jgi:hypothetical protein